VVRAELLEEFRIVGVVLIDKATCSVVQRVPDDGRVVGGVQVVAAEILVVRVVIALASLEVILLSAIAIAASTISAHFEESVCRANAVGLHETAPICTGSCRAGVMGFSGRLQSCSRRV
jgi:hypothetical protein